MEYGIHLNPNKFVDIKNPIENALHDAIKKNVKILQIFLGDRRLTTLKYKFSLTVKEIKEIKKILKENNIKLFVHSIFSLNFCNDPTSPRYKWGLDNLIYDLEMCQKLGAKGCVLHMGSFKTKKLNITPEQCIQNYVNSLLIILKMSKSKVPILLETPVNRKTTIGGTIEKLASIYSTIPKEYKKRIKFCIDTAHIFVSGYNISKKENVVQYFKDFNKIIGIKNIALIHLNDSQKELGSIINRHETIGKGFIFKNGKESLKYIIQFAKKNKIPFVLETKYETYIKELKLIQSLDKNQHGGKKEKINHKKNIIKIFKDLLFFHKSLVKQNIQTRFRIQGYEKAIQKLEQFKNPIYSIEDIKNIDGIGKKSLLKIDEIIKTGTLKLYKNIGTRNYKKESSLELFQKIWGIGPSFAKIIVSKNIYSIQQLKEAVKKNKIIITPQQKIGLLYFNDLKKRIPREEITYYTKLFKSSKNKYEVHNAGSYRIGKETSGDIDIIITIKNKNEDLKKKSNIFYEEFKKKGIIQDILVNGEHKSIYIIHSKKYKTYRQLDIAFIYETYLPWYLLYFGSSRDFSKKIRSIASKKGYKLNEYGLFNRITGRRINFEPNQEKEIFDYLKIDYVVPEKR
jgi:apurinic endonuclease APN1